MAGGIDPGDDEEMGRALRALPRHRRPPASARLWWRRWHRRHGASACRRGSPPRLRARHGADHAAVDRARAAPGGVADPLRPLTRAVIDEHSRTILWGESRPDVVPTVLPRAMDESGVSLNWVFTGDDQIQLINAQPIYLEGRRGMELAYQDADGHTVTYLILPLAAAGPARARPRADRPLASAGAQGQRLHMIMWRSRACCV